jgi:hypothetical protein
VVPGNYTIVRTQGDTFILNFNVSGYNFTGYTAKFQVRASSATTTKLLDLSTDSGITMNSSGDVAITAAASLMSFDTGRYVYDFQITSPGGEVTTLLAGKFVLSSDVAR